MALICDTGGVFGLYDADDAHHAAIKAVVEREPGPLFLPVVLLAEVDYLLSTRLGQEARSRVDPHPQGSFRRCPPSIWCVLQRLHLTIVCPERGR